MFGFNRPYVRDTSRLFTPTYVPGENYSFYLNMDNIVADGSFIYKSVFLVNSLNATIAFIGYASQVYIAGTVGYDIYISDFIFPRVPDGYYQFKIYDDENSIEMFRSNWIVCNSYSLSTTTPIKFRHNDQLFGVRYDLLPDFYQKFRMPINQINSIDVKSDRESYRQSSNGRELINSKSFIDIGNKLEFYWADDEDFDAVGAMLEHNEIYIAGNRIMDMSQVKVDKVQEQSELSKGTIDVIVQQYDINTRRIEHYGEFILWGGNSNNILTEYLTS